jgi:hypothetical protein
MGAQPRALGRGRLQVRKLIGLRLRSIDGTAREQRFVHGVVISVDGQECRTLWNDCDEVFVLPLDSVLSFAHSYDLWVEKNKGC